MTWHELRIKEGNGFIAKRLQSAWIYDQLIYNGQLYVMDFGKIKQFYLYEYVIAPELAWVKPPKPYLWEKKD